MSVVGRAYRCIYRNSEYAANHTYPRRKCWNRVSIRGRRQRSTRRVSRKGSGRPLKHVAVKYTYLVYWTRKERVTSVVCHNKVGENNWQFDTFVTTLGQVLILDWRSTRSVHALE